MMISSRLRSGLTIGSYPRILNEGERTDTLYSITKTAFNSKKNTYQIKKKNHFCIKQYWPGCPKGRNRNLIGSPCLLSTISLVQTICFHGVLINTQLRRWSRYKKMLSKLDQWTWTNSFQRICIVFSRQLRSYARIFIIIGVTVQVF